ncbi:MAG: maleylpyruvate isomerase N-terminal domain-containing protein [Dehalococcoidia bacterium]
MTSRTFASWMEPIAAQFCDTRAELVAAARAMPEEAWARPSPNEGWTYKDLLAHVAGDTDKNFLRVVRDVLDREPVDLATFTTGVDERNARNIEERRGRTIDELIAEIEADGEEAQELLARFTAADENWQPEGLPTTVANGLRSIAGGHEREHTAHLRAALKARA